MFSNKYLDSSGLVTSCHFLSQTNTELVKLIPFGIPPEVRVKVSCALLRLLRQMHEHQLSRYQVWMILSGADKERK